MPLNIMIGGKNLITKSDNEIVYATMVAILSFHTVVYLLMKTIHVSECAAGLNILSYNTHVSRDMEPKRKH